jgi:hypothetical protein
MAIGIAGTIGSALSDDSPIVGFVKNTVWGTNGKMIECSKYEYLHEELKNILPIINGFTASCHVEPRDSTSLFPKLIIDICPNVYTEASKITISQQQITYSSEDVLDENTAPLDLDNSSAKIITEGNRTIIRYQRNFLQAGTSFSANLKMDVYGDGAFILPSVNGYVKIGYADLSAMPGNRGNTAKG